MSLPPTFLAFCSGIKLIPVFLFSPIASSIQNASAPHDQLANVSEYVTRASRLLIRQPRPMVSITLRWQIPILARL